MIQFGKRNPPFSRLFQNSVHKGVNPTSARERFHEAHELIVKAWTDDGPFSWGGGEESLHYARQSERFFVAMLFEKDNDRKVSPEVETGKDPRPTA
jgi:hypothetical protein